MGMTVEEYKQEMHRQYNAKGTIREKAQYLVDLYTAQWTGIMSPAERTALADFTVDCITPRNDSGAFDFHASEQLYEELGKLRAEMSVDLGRKMDARVADIRQNGPGPDKVGTKAFSSSDPKIREQALYSLAYTEVSCGDTAIMSEVYGAILQGGEISYMATPEAKKRLEMFEDAYRRDYKPLDADYISQMHQYTGQSTIQYINSLSADEQLLLQKGSAQDPRQFTYLSLSPEERQNVKNPNDIPKVSPADVGIADIGDLTDDAKKRLAQQSSVSMIDVRNPIMEGFQSDYERIYDLNTLTEWMDQTIGSMDMSAFRSDDPAVAARQRTLQKDLKALQQELHDLANDPTHEMAGQFYDPKQKKLSATYRRIPPATREKTECLLEEMRDLMKDMPDDVRQQVRDQYKAKRSGAAYSVEDKISRQTGYSRVDAGISESTLREMDLMYYKMREKDKSGPFHRDSKEYKAMFEAVERVHKARASYDPSDARSVADMQGLFAQVYGAADTYAKKEAYSKKRTPMGIQRKNTALSLMYISSNGDPLPQKVVDTRSSMFGDQMEFKDLMNHVRNTNRAEYGVMAEQDRRPLAAEALAARKSAKAQRAVEISEYRMKSMNDTMSNSNDETRITYFGLDPQYTNTSGLDHSKTEQVPPDQKAMFDRIDKILSTSSETSELGRGGLGGLTALSSIAFMSAHPEVSLMDAMNPDAFVAEKREAAKTVLSALEKANNADPRDMKPLGELVGEGMNMMMKRDLKKDMLIYLGKDPDLSPEEAKAVFNAPENREKLISMTAAYYNFTVQNYQALQLMGLKGMKGAWSFSEYDPSKTGTEAWKKVVPQGVDQQEVKPFMDAVLSKVSPEQMKQWGVMRKNANIFTGGRQLKDHYTGFKRGSLYDGERAARANVELYTMLDVIAEGGSILDPRLDQARTQMRTVPLNELGIPGDVSVDQMVYQGFEGLSSPQIKINAKVTAQQRQMVPPVSEAQTGPVAMTSPPPMQPSVSQGVPLPTAPPPMQPRVSQSVPLPTVTQVAPPPPKKEDPKPEESKKEERKKDPEPEEPKKEEAKKGPKKEDPKKEDHQKDGPQTDQTKTRPRSKSVHSATHAARQGKYRPAPKPPTTGAPGMGGR